MALDVVVVNYKTPELLSDFIDSYRLFSWEGCTLAVVEVDEGGDQSIPEHCDFFDGFSFNTGYAMGCNTGARHGKNDVILLANADTVLSAGLKECHDALMSRDDWGVLGPRQVNVQNAITAGGIFGPDQAPYQRGWNDTDLGQYSDVREDALTVSGSLYFIKRHVWKELTECPLYQEAQPGAEGAFLHTPHYFEETFCSYHARSHGYKCVYYGPVQMLHHWHSASNHGGWADQQFHRSQAMHREACRVHGIVCE